MSDERIAVCAVMAGAAALILIGISPAMAHVGLLIVCIGLAGVARLTGSRAPYAAAALLVVAWLLDGLWSTIPDALVDMKFMQEHDTIVAVPRVLGEIMVTLALILGVAAVRPLAGPGLTTFAIVLLAFARVMTLLLLLSDSPSAGESPVRAVLAVLIDASRGFGIAATAFAWVVVAVGSPAPSPIQRRGAAFIAVVASFVLAAILPATRGMPRDLAPFVFFAIFLLAPVAFGRLAGAGFGSGARIAMVLSIVQLVVLVLTMVRFDRVLPDSYVPLLEMALPLGFLAFALAAIATSDLPFRRIRGLVAALFVLSAVGSFVTAVAVFASLQRIIRIQDPFRPLAVITRPMATSALILFVCILMYLMAPPSTGPAQTGAALSRDGV